MALDDARVDTAVALLGATSAFVDAQNDGVCPRGDSVATEGVRAMHAVHIGVHHLAAPHVDAQAAIASLTPAHSSCSELSSEEGTASSSSAAARSISEPSASGGSKSSGSDGDESTDTDGDENTPKPQVSPVLAECLKRNANMRKIQGSLSSSLARASRGIVASKSQVRYLHSQRRNSSPY